MKLSASTIGIVLFTVAGIAVFVLMAKRPAVDGSAMNFGMPVQSAVVEEKTPEATTPEATSITTETTTTSMPEATTPEMPVTPEVEPVEAGEVTSMPATLETSTLGSTDTEVKTEEVPVTAPSDAPAPEDGTTTN